ncbi:MAG: MarR family transcriptional regulator [Bacteroidetes bacterium]|nr:MarR family transcriptional regulator [Bacteroidota bacterium]
MSYTNEQKDGFFEAVESMKKYRRADLIDEKGRSLLEKLYTDLLPNELVLKKALLNNTTFFIGRKGTGKSTIFLRLEQELRKKENYLSCYLDVKTIYEKSQSQYSSIAKVKEVIPEELFNKYLIERTFIQNTLIAVQEELNKKYNSLGDKFASIFITTKPEAVKERIDELLQRISDNKTLENIEIPLLRSITSKLKNTNEDFKERETKLGGLEVSGGIKTDGIEGGIKTDSGFTWKKGMKDTNEIESEFSSVLLQVFQIKEIINEIKSILSILKIDHLFILLDDFSEIDDHAIIRFVDVILAPLNNWSDEFIKFKIAAYPGRLYYGKIDPGKIDTIYLDFYNLYSQFERDKMEVSATDFAKRLVDSRIQYYTNTSASEFFDTDSLTIEEYYNLFFKVSMNVPRILGYILSFCYQSKTVYDKKINRTDIESASQRYYEDKILTFFDSTTYSLLSIDEKISILQLRELLGKINDKLSEIRKKIQTKELTGASYTPTIPYATHFYFNPDLEKFLKTLELNFFINKYNDMSDKDGIPSSIYCINYGLARKLNIPWGKPEGNQYRKYFIERPFSFTKLIIEFLNGSKRIQCINPEYKKEYSIDELKFLEFNKFKCNVCSFPVEMKSISDNITQEIEAIDTSKFLPTPELKIIQELLKSEDALYAREIAQEIDYSGQLIGWRGKKLAEDHNYVTRIREKEGASYKYKLTDEGKEYFE